MAILIKSGSLVITNREISYLKIKTGTVIYMIVLHFPRRVVRGATLFLSLLLVFVIGLILGGNTINPFANVSEEVSLKPIYAVDTDQKLMAISFDATWGAERTEKILAILDQYEIKTTFFLVNIWMEEYPEMVKEIAERGHEVELHSASHPSFTTLSEEQIRDELSANDEMIQALTGQKPRLFRPPFGDYNDTVIKTVQSMGYEVIQWSIDSLDWQGLTAEAISGRILDGAANGAIVLLHNDGENTPEALSIFLPQLIEKGYQIVPVSQLIYRDNYYVDYNGIQRRQAPG